MNSSAYRTVSALAALALCASIILGGCSGAAEKAGEVKAETERRLQTVMAVAQEVKSEIDKIHKTTTEYDLVISDPEEGDEKLKAHQEQLAAMNRIEVDGLTVGYEERQDRSLKGATYERHFRVTWATNGKIVGLSYYSKKETDFKAFEELARKMIPIVNNQMRQQGLL
ncbi:MAG: hypothetical protein AB1631_14120 [Acidobacteriota bacterium]